MKKVSTFVTMAFLLLASCGRFVNATEVIDTIQVAAANNHQLENGKFETLLSMESENEEENFYQKTDGSFVKTDEETYDWHYVTYFPGKYALISSELVEQDGQQFHKVIVDPLEGADWNQLDQPLMTFDGIATILTEPEISEADIENVMVEKEETCTLYKIRMKEEYTERQKDTNLKQLETEIERLKSTNATTDSIHGFIERLEQLENTQYDDVMVTYIVDENDHLTSIQYAFDVTYPDELRFTFEHTHSLMDYNIPDNGELLPIIGK